MSTPRTLSLLKRVQTHPLLWPVVTLVLILMVNASLNPGFWMLQWRDGHLYGSVIDILNRAAPLMLVSLGMTLVIATRGIDSFACSPTAGQGPPRPRPCPTAP